MRDPAPVLVWFRRDLRLADHPALSAAAHSGQPVLPVFVLHDAERPAGAASRWWLHRSLAALEESLAARGSRLILRRGEPDEVLAALAAESGASALCWNSAIDPGAAAVEARVTQRLGSQLTIRRFMGDALQAPGTVHPAGSAPYRAFAPFWRAFLDRPHPPPPLPAPHFATAAIGQMAEGRPVDVEQAGAGLAGESLDDWQLLPRPDWAAGLRAAWQPGEASAGRALRSFVQDRVAAYDSTRDRPDRDGTSRLSPHLHFGELSPRQVWHAIGAADAVDAHGDSPGRPGGATEGAAGGRASFLRELAWREFSLHLLHAWPDLASRPLQPAFARLAWRDDPAALRAWQRGLTGYPLVDAGMRQLWATGWMHNRVRMVAASFLVKHLLIDWREGERWFWDTLVDADVANNATSWQWVAGSGADSMPWFRIFNPVLQGRKFDPQGAYVQRWVPELARLPQEHVHAPWEAPRRVLEAAGVRIGREYPAPVVEHAAARARALAAFAALREPRSHAGAT
jgi:deoxyribodipyrimidine photo-lyase